MLATLMANIKTTLETSTKIAPNNVFDRPLDQDEHPTGMPAVVFYPDNFSNEFLTNNENLRGYNFAIFVMAETQVKTVSQAMTILANAVDDILEKFDAGWNGGTIDNHRVWQKVNQGRWEFSLTERGMQIVCPLNLIINVAIDN